MADQLTPGYYRIISAELSSYDELKKTDITFLIHDMTISEGISKSSIRGHITIADTMGLIDEYPLRGEEKLVIKYEDPFTHEVELVLQVYAITNIEVSVQGNAVTYKLHFVSEPRARSEGALISRSYSGRISEMVKDIFDEYFGSDKEIDIEETVGEYKIIIPKLSPDQAIRFLGRRAYSEENTSQSFMFFETKERFYFATYEYVMQKEEELEPAFEGLDRLKTFTFDPMYDGTGDGLLKMMAAAISLTPIDRVDTVKYSGRNPYKKVTRELDIIQRSVIPTDFSYQEAVALYAKNTGETPSVKNSERYIEDRFNDNIDEMYVIRDYSDQVQGLYTGNVPVTGQIDSTVPDDNIPTSYTESVAQTESSGDPNAQSSTSSASGLFGFTNGTWRGLMNNYPDAGLTFEGKNDPEQQRLAMALLTKENGNYLQNQGIEVNNMTLYAAHNLGGNDARKVLKSPSSARLTSILSPGVITANPHFKNMTVADYKNWASGKSGGGQNRVLVGPPLEYSGIQDLGMKSNTYYPEIMNNKTAFLQHINDSPVKMMIYGRNDIVPGNMIQLNIPEFRYTPGERRINNKILSGRYIVETVNSYMFRDEFKQELTLQKLDWNGDMLDA